MRNFKDIMLGCNYWASNAGTDMWVDFKPEVIRKDMELLSSHGVKYLRIFPNWRDFQPVEPVYKWSMMLKEYQLTGNRKPENMYYLDTEMLDRFEQFCDIAHEFGMKLIVGLLTGWMSGRCFVPPALNGKELLTDRTALYFEQLYITGLVERFKAHPAIYAWDHGNEIQCMGNAGNVYEATFWAQMLSNAVYSVDRTRPLITGLNGPSLEGLWRIDKVAQGCDMLVTHPYIFWGGKAGIDKNTYIRSTLYPTALTRMYADIGGKPCLVEEIGTMGPSVCSEDMAADFLRVNFFSSLANGSTGLLYWCAFDQTRLMPAPYSYQMVENELGMAQEDHTPKPVLKEMKRLSELGLDLELPEADIDAVCLLTANQDSIGIAYVTYILAKQAGLNIAFADAAAGIPEAKAYIMPSVTGNEILPKENYIELKKRVSAGAKLYISQDGGILSDFEALTGNRITDSRRTGDKGTFELGGKTLSCSNSSRTVYYDMIGSESVAGDGLITRHAYGDGEVYFVNFAIEAALVNKPRAFDDGYCEVYREIFKQELEGHIIRLDNENVALTLHRGGDKVIAIAVNHSESTQKLSFKTDLRMGKVHYGSPDACPAMDAVIVEFEK